MTLENSSKNKSLIYRFPYKVDVNPMLAEVSAHYGAWNYNPRRQNNIYVQKNTESIPIVHSRSRMGIRLADSEDHYETLLYPHFPAVTNFVDYFVQQYGGDRGRIAIVKLPPQKKVLRHIDEGAYYRKRDRFHLVVQGMYEYIVGEERDIFSAGDLFWFDSQSMHETLNIGTQDRIVIIFEIENSKFREILNVE
jgi:hypothetical protein